MYESRLAFKVLVIDQPLLWSHALRGSGQRAGETPALGASRQSSGLPRGYLRTAQPASPSILERTPFPASKPVKPTHTK